MGTVREIEAAIRNLSRKELSRLRKWFVEFDAKAWDEQFEDDVRSGRLDAVAEEALQQLRQGRCTDL